MISAALLTMMTLIILLCLLSWSNENRCLCIGCGWEDYKDTCRRDCHIYKTWAMHRKIPF